MHARAVKLSVIACSTATEFRPREANMGAYPTPARLPPILERNWRLPEQQLVRNAQAQSLLKTLLHMCDGDRNNGERWFLQLFWVSIPRSWPCFQCRRMVPN